MGQLTDVRIRHWVKAGKRVAKSDGGGLTFTLSPKGTAAWVLRYRFGGKARELTLARYPDASLAKARELAGVARVRIQTGSDVAREKRLASLSAASSESFRQLAEDYMAKRFPDLAPNTTKQRGHHIRDLIIPKLGSLAARDISTANVVAVVEAVGQRSQSTAGLVLTALSEIFKHGQARHVVTANPCAGITITAICGRSRPARQRLMLTEDELRALLPALPTIGSQNALAVKILLATCVRIGELARAEWTHLDLDTNDWRIPDVNSKTGRGFVVPLPADVVHWFQELRVFAGSSRFVLPARQQRRREGYGGDVCFEQRTLNSMIGKLCGRPGSKIRRFTPHDLRSTARSHLAALGVDLIVAERCLNHSVGGLVAVYDRHDYLEERRSALSLWTRFLMACESGTPWRRDNVVPMRATRLAS